MKQILLVVLVGMVTISCSNIFKTGANTTTDSALLEDAIKSIDAGDYALAVTKIIAMSADARGQESIRRLLAKAYAGACGLNFINFLASLSGSDPFLLLMMKAWTNKTTDPASCRLAEDTMKLIAPTYATRTGDDAFFMVILGLAKIGVYLDSIADATQPSDGVADSPPFDGTIASFCDIANITDAQVAEVGTGIGLVFANLTAIGGSLPGSSLDTTAIDAACNLIVPNPCAIEDQATLLADAAALKAIRTLLNTNSIGLVNGLPCP